MILQSQTGADIHIDDLPLKRGGEGSIYRVSGNLVAKIYHTAEKAALFNKKLQFMVGNSPLVKAAEDVTGTIIWPQQLLFDKNKFVGFTMPMVENGIKLFTFCQNNFPLPKHGQEWQKFHHSHPDALRKRMMVCYNLARAVDFLHQSGNYLLVDMKPENILVKPNGHIAIIDLDSIQIVKGKKLLFAATAYTPEYAPPELHHGKIKFAAESLSKNYDNFSLAVILYQVLMSVHPFQASHPVFTAVHENIMHGMYVHGENRKQLHRIPLLHKNLKLLPASIRLLFHKTFKKGNENPRLRTPASVWASKLLLEINNQVTPTTLPPRETTLAPQKGKKTRVKSAGQPSSKKIQGKRNQGATTKIQNAELPVKGIPRSIVDILFRMMGMQ
jgi:DNA-binding helix-hairpin-helix protein with protein kinase domain